MTKRFRIICLVLCFLLLFTGTAAAQLSDIQGHWAETQIADWVDKGWITGYKDGTFRPNSPITRAEFAALANRAFGFTASETAAFSDVSENAWYAKDVSVAKAAGYITGYNDGSFKPLANISRQEAAAMISRILDLDVQSYINAAEKFSDSGTFPAWSKPFIGAVSANGLMKGYSDNTFLANKNISRAEAVITLDNALNHDQVLADVTYNTAGIYGPETGMQTIEGNVVISAPGVTLRNTLITGNLLFAQGIGNGNVSLNNVTVKGVTTVKGGGGNSIFLQDCSMPTMIVDKEGVRIVASGKTSIKIVTLESGAILVEMTAAGAGFDKVIISETVPAGTKITLSGDFSEVTVDSPVDLFITSTSWVGTLTLNAAANVTGTGTIEKAVCNVSGFNIQQEPEEYTLADGVEGTINDETVTGDPVSGGGGGGGGGGLSPAIYAEQITVHFLSAASPSVDAGLSVDGLTANVDLTGHSSDLAIEKVFIDAPNGSYLIPALVTSQLDVTYDMHQDELQEPIEGLPRDVPISELLGVSNSEVYLGTLRAVFGDWVAVSGTLYCDNYRSQEVSLTLLLNTP